MKNGRKAEKIKLSQMNLFLKKQLIKFSCTYWHLSLWKFLKNSSGWSRVMSIAIFGPKIAHLSWTNIFWKNINIIVIYLEAPFIVKKVLPADPELWGCAVFGSKMAYFPKLEFFSKNLSMSLISFIHAYLHAKDQSQILIY